MSRPLIVSLALVTALAAGTVAVAQVSAPAAAARTGKVEQKVSTGEQPLIRPGDRDCLRHTGSLIPAKKGHCLPVTGRSYSREELQRTGTQNTARALQMLDPSISVGH
jgi:hypothetical protein